MGDPVSDTSDPAYAQRLVQLQGSRWKSLLGVQIPYRWNLRRLLQGKHRVLDIGCGIGRNLDHLGRGVGVDHNVSAVAAARARGLRAWTTQEWPDSPDARPASFEGVVLAHVLEHVSATDATDIVTSYLPYLTDDARMVLICPQERGYASDASHIRWVDLDIMAKSAREWGFRPVRQMSFPLPRSAGKLFTYNEFVVVADRSSAS